MSWHKTGELSEEDKLQTETLRELLRSGDYSSAFSEVAKRFQTKIQPTTIASYLILLFKSRYGEVPKWVQLAIREESVLMASALTRIEMFSKAKILETPAAIANDHWPHPFIPGWRAILDDELAKTEEAATLETLFTAIFKLIVDTFETSEGAFPHEELELLQLIENDYSKAFALTVNANGVNVTMLMGYLESQGFEARNENEVRAIRVGLYKPVIWLNDALADNRVNRQAFEREVARKLHSVEGQWRMLEEPPTILQEKTVEELMAPLVIMLSRCH